VDPTGEMDSMDIVNFNICPQRQFISDNAGEFEVIHFTPVNHGICRNGCGLTHIEHGSVNSHGEPRLVDGDLDYTENCPLIEAPIGEIKVPFGQGNANTRQFVLCSNGCGLHKKDINQSTHDCTGVVVRGFQTASSNPPTNVPFPDVPIISESAAEKEKPWVRMLFESARLTNNAILQRKAVQASYVNKQKLIERVGSTHADRAAKRRRLLMKMTGSDGPRNSSTAARPPRGTPPESPARVITSTRDRDRKDD